MSYSHVSKTARINILVIGQQKAVLAVTYGILLWHFLLLNLKDVLGKLSMYESITFMGCSGATLPCAGQTKGILYPKKWLMSYYMIS